MSRTKSASSSSRTRRRSREGTADMVRQMVGRGGARAPGAAAIPAGGLGTDVAAIMAAHRRGVERGRRRRAGRSGRRGDEQRRWRSRCSRRSGAAASSLCNAPIVEGAMMAAAEAPTGSPRRGARHRRGALAVNDSEAERVMVVPGRDGCRRRPGRGSITIMHAVGLHARPAVKLTQLAATFASDIRAARRRGAAAGSTPRASSKVMKLKCARRSRSAFRGRGQGRRGGRARVSSTFVQRDFDE